MLFICLDRENEKKMNAMHIPTPFHNQRRRKEKLSEKKGHFVSFLLKSQNRVTGERPCKRPRHKNCILTLQVLTTKAPQQPSPILKVASACQLCVYFPLSA